MLYTMGEYNTQCAPTSEIESAEECMDAVLELQENARVRHEDVRPVQKAYALTGNYTYWTNPHPNDAVSCPLSLWLNVTVVTQVVPFFESTQRPRGCSHYFEPEVSERTADVAGAGYIPNHCGPPTTMSLAFNPSPKGQPHGDYFPICKSSPGKAEAPSPPAAPYTLGWRVYDTHTDCAPQTGVATEQECVEAYAALRAVNFAGSTEFASTLARSQLVLPEENIHFDESEMAPYASSYYPGVPLTEEYVVQYGERSFVGKGGGGVLATYYGALGCSLTWASRDSSSRLFLPHVHSTYACVAMHTPAFSCHKYTR